MSGTRVNMATIISEAEVTAAIEKAFAENFDDMEDSSSVDLPIESKIERLRLSFEPKNKYVTEVKDMNEYVMSYFESLNHMSRRIITEQREVIAECGSKWDQLSPEEQDKLIDDRMLGPKVKKHYYVDDTFSTRKPVWFPVLRLAHGISGSENSFNPRDSVASVSEMHSKDQFSAPWSWETKSQQDLSLLEKGELEERLKLALESDRTEINTMSTAEFKRQALYNELETRSKGTSHSGSIPGSEPLSRKEFTFDGAKHSVTNSAQGSKASLSSLSSAPKGSKASLVSTTPPKGSKASLISTTPPKGSKSSLLSTTPPKGSKSSLATATPPKGSKSSLASLGTPPKQGATKMNLTSETPRQETKTSFMSPLLNDPIPQMEETAAESQESKGSSANENEITGLSVDAASDPNDLMAFLQNW
ncbi:serine-rich adhesin for platelets-like [Montipora capricornis]|uniref:serine-rich adhesin for platelets-like n=1 Tax=Montipora capricornis TaxID=246305 RepID=UPI0035F20A8B